MPRLTSKVSSLTCDAVTSPGVYQKTRAGEATHMFADFPGPNGIAPTSSGLLLRIFLCWAAHQLFSCSREHSSEVIIIDTTAGNSLPFNLYSMDRGSTKYLTGLIQRLPVFSPPKVRCFVHLQWSWSFLSGGKSFSMSCTYASGYQRRPSFNASGSSFRLGNSAWI